jgi:hypothetical protein
MLVHCKRNSHRLPVPAILPGELVERGSISERAEDTSALLPPTSIPPPSIGRSSGQSSRVSFPSTVNHGHGAADLVHRHQGYQPPVNHANRGTFLLDVLVDLTTTIILPALEGSSPAGEVKGCLPGRWTGIGAGGAGGRDLQLPSWSSPAE